MLAEALGVEKREPRSREVEYEPLMLSFYGANVVSRRSSLLPLLLGSALVLSALVLVALR